jgi:hypothetical protein
LKKFQGTEFESGTDVIRVHNEIPVGKWRTLTITHVYLTPPLRQNQLDVLFGSFI